jgi:hypothetical protein
MPMTESQKHHTNILGIFSRDALKKIREQDLLWENMVPKRIAVAIKRRGLFGHAIVTRD